MTRKNIVTAMVFMAVLLGGYYVYNNMFPVARPMHCPSIEAITAINISTDDNKESKILGADFAKTVTYIGNSRPTRTRSVNDTPTVRPYYKIEILTAEKMFNYYVYEKNNNVYIERPYEGIYIIDRQVVNIISRRFQ
ncbi:MAG: DUF5301 domain-containing protein [Firmicutes bacterium]|nr:DUF5301 domain-containing protein [Bacillota bacterium]